MVEFKYLKFCGDCAGELEKKNDTLYKCLECRKPTFNSSTSAAGVVVFRGDRVLMGVRGQEPAKGKLSEIGGFIDWMEQPEDAARREFKEEAGVEIISLRIISSRTGRYTKNQSVTATIYLATIDEDAELQAGDDVAELRWLPVAGLKKDDFLDPSVIEHIKRGYEMYLSGRSA